MISVFGSLVDQDEINRVSKCMESQWMGFGKDVETFESSFSKKFNIPNFLMVDSGSNALYMAVQLLNLPKGSEVIIPSFTWVSCAQAIVLAGHKPVFCDVELDNMNVSVNTIKPLINQNTAAIMVVHYAGLPVDMDPILDLGLPIIEDAAHAVDSLYKGKPCGTIGDIGIYSFDAVKNFTVGEGGGISMRSKAHYERAKFMRYCGIGKSGFDSASDSTKSFNRWWEYNIQEVFIKMLPTNLAANIGLAQLDKIDKLQSRRKEIWNYYNENLQGVTLPIDVTGGDKHSYFTYAIRTANRDKLAKYLFDNGVYTTLRYHPLHLNPVYGQLDKKLLNSETLNEDCLSIPIHPRLSDLEVEKVVSLINKFTK